MILTQSQQSAVDQIHTLLKAGKKLVSLSGPAGTGKTTVVKNIIEGIDDVEVCTPTNKAAQVLVSKGIDAATFFKRFYILQEKPVRGAKPSFISCRRFCEDLAAVRGGHWSDYERMLPEGKRAHVGVLVIDEGSMVTSRMQRELERMSDQLLLVGDANQLPPVNDLDTPAGFFSSINHDVTLTEILRQTEGSPVLEFATAIRTGNSSKVGRMSSALYPADNFEDWIWSGAKVIVFTNKERVRVNHVARKILGFNEPTPVPGDILVCTSNYDDTLINGTEVEVLDFQWDGVTPSALVRVKTAGLTLSCRMDMHSFIDDQLASAQALLSAKIKPRPAEEDRPPAELVFGYAITAHKAQGSEWDRVVVIDQTGLVRKTAMNDRRTGMPPDEVVRRWLYTCVTRARRDLTLAPSWWARVNASTEEAA